MIYLFIIIYISCLLFFMNSRIFIKLKQINKIILYIILVALAAFRFRVGGDTYYYMLVYDILPTFSEIFSSDLVLVKLQPLWLLLNSTSKWIGPDFFVFQIIHALYNK